MLRYKIDGVLFKATSSPKGVESALISRIKVLSNIDISEIRVPQDGGFSAKLEGKEIKLLVSNCPTIYGENFVFRILDKSKLNIDLKDSGLMGISLEKFSTFLNKPFLLASSIVGVLAQRLVRKICKVSYEPDRSEIAQLSPRGTDKKITLFKGEGCKAFKRSGYAGRMRVFEVLVVTDEIRELILREAAPMSILQLAQKSQGLKTIRQDALSKVLGG